MLKKKRFLSIISICAAVTLLYGNLTVFSLCNQNVLIKTASPIVPEISAKTGIIIENSTGTILYEKESHQKLAPASVTKIMTMLLVMEAIDSKKIAMSDKVTCSKLANSMGGTQIWLEVGEQMTVEDLLKATAVASANDAAMSLAEYVGGSLEGFVAMMNNKAKELGMNDTNFVNPTGLDAQGHLTSSNDIALMSRELIKHKDITKFTTIWMDSLRGGKTQLVNTNKLIRFYKGATGLKTGTTDKAGSCVSITATQKDMGLIVVVMGCTTSKERFESARKLLDYGFNNYTLFKASVSSETLKPVKVIGGTSDFVEVCTEEIAQIVIPKGFEDMIQQEVNLVGDVHAPVENLQHLGQLRLMLDEEELISIEIKARGKVEKITLIKSFIILLKKYILL